MMLAFYAINNSVLSGRFQNPGVERRPSVPSDAVGRYRNHRLVSELNLRPLLPQRPGLPSKSLFNRLFLQIRRVLVLAQDAADHQVQGGSRARPIPLLAGAS